MPTLGSYQIDKKLFLGLSVTLGISLLFPEYIAPFFIFILYIVFIRHFKKTNRNAKLGQIGKIFFTYMCFMIVSAIWSKTHVLSALIGLLWMGCFLCYIAVANIVNTKDKLKTAITAVNMSAGITGLIALLEFVTYNMTKHVDGFNFIIANPLYYNINDYIFSLFPIDIINNVYPSRAAATFDNPLILATYLVMATPFCAFGSVFFKHSKNRKISMVCFVLSLAGLFCTESRGAYVAIALSILTMLCSHKKIFKKLFPFIILLAIAFPLVLVIRNINSPQGDLSTSNGSRLKIWICCLNIFKDNPILGLGAGTENIHQILLSELKTDRSHAHNLFLEALVEGGIIGAAFVAVIIAVLVKNIISLFKLKGNRYRPYAILYTASLVGFITTSLFEHTLQSPKEMMMFFFLIGFIEATLRMAKDEIQLAEDELITYEEIDDKDFVTDKEEKILENIM